MGESGAVGQCFKLGALECGLNGNQAVVHEHAVPSKEPLGCGQEVIGQGAALQINGQNGPARDAGKVGEQRDDGVIREVVQKKRADYVIEAARAEGELKSVGADFGRGCGQQVRVAHIERADPGPGEPLSDSDSGLTRRRADVQCRERVGRRRQRAESRAQDAIAAEVAVDTGQVAEAFAGLGGAGMIEQLRFDDALGVNERFQGNSIIRRCSRFEMKSEPGKEK